MEVQTGKQWYWIKFRKVSTITRRFGWFRKFCKFSKKLIFILTFIGYFPEKYNYLVSVYLWASRENYLQPVWHWQFDQKTLKNFLLNALKVGLDMKATSFVALMQSVIRHIHTKSCYKLGKKDFLQMLVLSVCRSCRSGSTLILVEGVSCNNFSPYFT